MPHRRLPAKVWDFLPHLCGLPAGERDRRLILSLTAFVDDSGKDDPPVYLLAGFIARASQWAAFTDSWRAVLEATPKLEYFKMQEAHAFSGQFVGWSTAQRDERVLQLANVIKAHVLTGISASVLHDDYNATMRGKINKFMDRAYLMLFFNVMFSAYHWEYKNGLDEGLDFVFDEQKHDSDVVQSIWSGAVELCPPGLKNKLNRPIHRNDKETPPLQAADLFAWHLRRRYAYGDKFDSAALRVLLEIPHEETLLTRERLAKWLGRTMEINREEEKLFPYEIEHFYENMEAIITLRNQDAFAKAKPGQDVWLVPIPASGLKRFLLVHMCPRVRNPHLHRRAGDECLGV